VFVINFLALGLIWGYVARSYPAFAPARFWTGSSFAAAAGGAMATLRVVMPDSLLPRSSPAPLVPGDRLASMGIRFYNQPAPGATPSDHHARRCRPSSCSSTTGSDDRLSAAGAADGLT
jgi:hypothetical protein